MDGVCDGHGLHTERVNRSQRARWFYFKGLVGGVTVAAARAGVDAPSVTIAECERTHGFGAREPNDDVLHGYVLHGFQREGITSVDVGNKLLLGFLVARCF